MSDDYNLRKAAEQLTKQLANDGKLIAVGWQTYKLLCLKIPPHVSANELYEAYCVGAEHLFSAMIGMIDEETEETDTDMSRMRKLDDELEPIRQMLKLKYGRARGRA